MPEPYNKIKVITNESGKLVYSQEDYATWTNAERVLKADKNNIQRPYSKGLDLRDWINGADAADFVSKVNTNPVSKLDAKYKNPERIKKRDETLAFHAVSDLFVKQMDDRDGWKDIIGYDKKDIKDALREIAKSFIKTRAYKNVTRESVVSEIGKDVIKEAKRLGDDKQLMNITGLSNVEKVMRKMKKEAQKVNNKGNNKAPAL
ncbi:MAG: hypothetical protein K5750_02180 [Eubacterium sp.]|nr:hypothetical protein [Eubacterium sp.]